MATTDVFFVPNPSDYITSHHSATLHRLTAQRGLSVLSTLFLLSYIKSLSTVSSVLFSYSSITHIPSKKIMHTWSVDANISILGVKFIALFIISLILFAMILLFNIMTLFSKALMKYRCINKFKPLLKPIQNQILLLDWLTACNQNSILWYIISGKKYQLNCQYHYPECDQCTAWAVSAI